MSDKDIKEMEDWMRLNPESDESIGFTGAKNTNQNTFVLFLRALLYLSLVGFYVVLLSFLIGIIAYWVSWAFEKGFNLF